MILLLGPTIGILVVVSVTAWVSRISEKRGTRIDIDWWLVGICAVLAGVLGGLLQCGIMYPQETVLQQMERMDREEAVGRTLSGRMFTIVEVDPVDSSGDSLSIIAVENGYDNRLSGVVYGVPVLPGDVLLANDTVTPEKAPGIVSEGRVVTMTNVSFYMLDRSPIDHVDAVARSEAVKGCTFWLFYKKVP